MIATLIKNLQKPLALHSLALILAVILSVAIGAVFISPGSLLRILLAQLPGLEFAITWPASFEVIVLQIRLPHTILIALTGAALGGSGAAYQGLFRNPLADPYLIGVASGAGLGAVIMMALREQGWFSSLYAIPIAAFLAALLTVGAVYLLANTPSRPGVFAQSPTTTLVLAGVAVSSFATALTSFLMLQSQGELRRALAWLLGSATLSGWEPVLAALPYIAIGLGILLSTGHSLNVLQFGEEQAEQLGLPVRRMQVLIVAAASLSTATAVSFAGVIGFVGLITPHLARLAWGSDYRKLIPLSISGGATMLLLADTLARIVLAPQELPVGILTALAGAPFFIWVLRRAQSSSQPG